MSEIIYKVLIRTLLDEKIIEQEVEESKLIDIINTCDPTKEKIICVLLKGSDIKNRKTVLRYGFTIFSKSRIKRYTY